MKKFTFSFLFIISIFFVDAQEKDSIPSDNVPFAIIDQAPIFPGCEKLDKDLQKLCLQNQIKKHVAKSFNTKIVRRLNLEPGKKKVYVQFKISKEGFIVDVRARGPHKEIEMEGIRVVESLPNMIPGKQKGRNVGVKYTLPITFLVEPEKKKKRKKS